MSREEGIGVMEKASGETLRKHGHRGSGQQDGRVKGEVEGAD